MQRISGTTAVNGKFVDGTATQNGTIVNAEWLNTIQEEICGFIETQKIPLNRENNLQLIDAMSKFVESDRKKTAWCLKKIEEFFNERYEEK